MKLFRISSVAACAALALAATAWGHDGRRLDIQVVDNQLVAQGYISGGQPDDGGGLVRPYYNVIHGHFHNLGGNAFADLPGFDILSSGPLAGYSVSAELLSVSKWVNPPVMPSAGTVPSLTPLTGELLEVERLSQSVDSNTLGSLILTSNVQAPVHPEIDMLYTIDTNPSAVIYALEWQLSTTAPGISPSGSVYTLLSPDGANAQEKLHMASLYLESYLGVPVPEPTSVALLGSGLLGLAAWSWRRRKSAA